MSRNLLVRKPVGKLIWTYNGTTNLVTTSAWKQLFAEIPTSASAMEIFDSSGRILRLSFGDPGEEELAGNELPYYVIPGGSSILLPMDIARGTPLSARAVDTNASVGNMVINFFG